MENILNNNILDKVSISIEKKDCVIRARTKEKERYITNRTYLIKSNRDMNFCASSLVNSACFCILHLRDQGACRIVRSFQSRSRVAVVSRRFQVAASVVLRFTVCMLAVVDLRTCARKATECNSGSRFVITGTIVCMHYSLRLALCI